MILGKYSFGVGDRFSHQGEAQLRAIMKANNEGVQITPVWNKSNREHDIIRSEPADTRVEADAAVKQLGWKQPYFVDADHINLSTVERFIDSADFFTLDVAANICQPSQEEETTAFKASCASLGDEVVIPGIPEPLMITDTLLEEVAGKYLSAVTEAGRIYRHIEQVKGA